jgi:hypothetical protein
MKPNELVALYFDNLPKEQLVRPTGAQVGGQIKNLLKTVPVEALVRLIPVVAKEGKPLSVGTLMIAQGKMPKVTKTYTPPAFNRQEVEERTAKSAPMPENLKALIKAIRFNGDKPPLDDFDAL